MSIHVLYDGWDLAYRPHSPAALHLLAILAHLPADVQASIALPKAVTFALPENASAVIEETSHTAGDKLAWQQNKLAKVFDQVGADLLHLTQAQASLFSNIPTVVSPTGYGNASRSGGFAARLGEALGKGGMSTVQAILWPSDLPKPEDVNNLYELPPIVHPDFEPYQHYHPPEIPELELPETYLLYHGAEDEGTLAQLLQRWSWGAGAIGEYYPLYLVGLGEGAKEYVERMMPDESVRCLAVIAPDSLAKVYQGCSALYHLGPVSPWGGPIRHMLACARPVVGLETPEMDALVGPAAFLVPDGDERAFASAMISIVVNQEIYEPVMKAAYTRSEPWRNNDYGEKLVEVYTDVLGK
ncbi:MAG: glycosyltransferase [Chloroflexi bacterium]|nr:glycosyltransferase [Chloroflexota bacterium]